MKLCLAKIPSGLMKDLIYEPGDGSTPNSRLEQGGLVNTHRHEFTAELVPKGWQAQLSRCSLSTPRWVFGKAAQAARS